jgi:putative CocE/NonD family hydrolase
MDMIRKTLFLLIIIIQLPLLLFAQNIDEAWVKENYHKREVMIPMRDSVRLYTAIYEPVSVSRRHPILIYRSPYGSRPYGKGYQSALWRNLKGFSQKGYIIIYQDVRGERMSEGTFENVRPIQKAMSAKVSDDVTDMYDTVEWLLHHTFSNGRVGVTGNSYLGYYALTAAVCAHPAIKAVCPQAPIGDWFMGDDIHHNGALMLTDAFSFLSSFDRPRAVPCENNYPYKQYYSGDDYSFFLKAGPLKNVTRMLGDSIRFWKDMVQHPNYDEWWKERNPFASYSRVKAAVLVVGGLFDAEDAYGTWQSYKTLDRTNSHAPLYLLVGPWTHGGWNGSCPNKLGDISFGEANTCLKFADMQQRFFDCYLLEEGQFGSNPKATIFFSGENCWRTFDCWPSAKVRKTPLYLRAKGGLSFDAPKEKQSYSEYVSDPSHPVPYTATPVHRRPSKYMVADQRFVNNRPDVLTFSMPALTEKLTLGGELTASLLVSLSTTDADFIVKLIDVFPDGYEMLVRWDVMRGRYRKSFSRPSAFVCNKPEKVEFKLSDIAHTFLKGHRIMVQIQSTCFPLVDRNPQQFVDIYHCSELDFVPSTIRLYHQKGQASKLMLPVL